MLIILKLKISPFKCSCRSSCFFTSAQPFAAAQRYASTSKQVRSRQGVQVEASKGKQRMRMGGNMPQQSMPNIPVPPVDPDNVEFVIFVRSKKLLQWMPLSIMKGGAAANMLVKSQEVEIGKKLYGNALIENVAKAIYKDKSDVERTLRSQFPMFKAVKEFEYGFKIRDKENPKSWYLANDIQILPPEEEISASPVENVSNFFQNIGKNLGLDGISKKD